MRNMSNKPEPHELFPKILALFQGVGAVGQNLCIERSGSRYRVFCDEKGLIIYRIVESAGTRHHVPGWPVCIVSHDHIFEEASLTCGENHHFVREPELEEWLELISDRLCENSVNGQ